MSTASDLAGLVISTGQLILTKLAELQHIVPTPASIGFVVSYGCALLIMPLLMLQALCSVCAMTEIGPVRKSMSSFFIVLLGTPLYPLITGLVLMIIWVLLYAFAIAVSAIAPLAITVSVITAVCEAGSECRAAQARRPPVTDDITCLELIYGIFMGLLSLATFGVLIALLAVLKSPLVLIGCVVSGSVKTFPSMMKESGYVFSKSELELILF